jgi:hypothetical protein
MSIFLLYQEEVIGRRADSAVAGRSISAKSEQDGALIHITRLSGFVGRRSRGTTAAPQQCRPLDIVSLPREPLPALRATKQQRTDFQSRPSLRRGGSLRDGRLPEGEPVIAPPQRERVERRRGPPAG